MEPVKEGVWNLVNHCAEVKKEDEVLILNEYGKVDEEIAALVTEAVKETKADYHVMWAESVERGRTSLPKVLVGAFLSADKVISIFSVNRALLDEYTQGQGRDSDQQYVSQCQPHGDSTRALSLGHGKSDLLSARGDPSAG